MSQEVHQRPGFWWVLLQALENFNPRGLAGLFALLAGGGGMMSGVSLLQVVSWVAGGAVLLVSLNAFLRVLPGLIREIFMLSIAVLCGMLASGWCMRNMDECGALYDTMSLRVAKTYNITTTFAWRLGEELFD